MQKREEEILYITGWEVGGVVEYSQKIRKKQNNTEGNGMVENKEDRLTVKRAESVLHKAGVVGEIKVLEYRDEGRVIASGETVLSTIESYLGNYLGINLDEIDSYEWRDIEWNREYEVSELGLIRHKETGEFVDYNLKSTYEEGKKDVWRVKTWIKGGETVRPIVSTVVAEAFLGERPEGYVVGHLNDIPLDNRASNLEYITIEHNDSMGWVLKDVVRKGLNYKQAEVIYKVTLDILEDLYGEDFEVDELTHEEELEVLRIMGDGEDVYKLSIGEIYKYFKTGEGALADLLLINGRFYV